MAASVETDEGIFLDHLCDKNPGIRSLCRRTVRQRRPELPENYFFEFYSREVGSSSSSKVVGAIAGLCETGEDCQLQLLQLIKSPSVRVRRAVLRALYIIGREKHSETFIEALVSGTAGESRDACTALAKMRNAINAERIYSLYSRASTEHTKSNLLVLLNHQSKWERLPILLRMISESEDSAQQQPIVSSLIEWKNTFNRDFSPPRPGQIEAARRELPKIGRILEPEFVESLSFFLKGW